MNLIKQDSVSIKIMIQSPASTAAVVQSLCQIQGHPQPHCPFHGLILPCFHFPKLAHITQLLNVSKMNQTTKPESCNFMTPYTLPQPSPKHSISLKQINKKAIKSLTTIHKTHSEINAWPKSH